MFQEITLLAIMCMQHKAIVIMCIYTITSKLISTHEVTSNIFDNQCTFKYAELGLLGSGGGGFCCFTTSTCWLISFASSAKHGLSSG